MSSFLEISIIFQNCIITFFHNAKCHFVCRKIQLDISIKLIEWIKLKMHPQVTEPEQGDASCYIYSQCTITIESEGQILATVRVALPHQVQNELRLAIHSRLDNELHSTFSLCIKHIYNVKLATVICSKNVARLIYFYYLSSPCKYCILWCVIFYHHRVAYSQFNSIIYWYIGINDWNFIIIILKIKSGRIILKIKSGIGNFEFLLLCILKI